MSLVSTLKAPARIVRDRSSAALMLSRFREHQRKNDRTAVLIATPIHGNLGDQAIVYAQKRFLADALPEYSIFEIYRFEYELSREKIASLIRPTDLVVIDGGGNVGTLWPEENAKMNDIVVRFKNNVVVIFPQTAYFDDSEAGRMCQQETAAAYTENPNLIFFSRDLSTYRKITEIAPSVTNTYVPDIVPYIDSIHGSSMRSGALLCLRADKERVIDDGLAELLNRQLAERGLAIKETSTVVSRRIGRNEREDELQAKWSEFSSAQIVVTDRLHGMYFSAITGTPCVALDNVSRKVSQGYKWIRDIPNIRLASCAEEIPSLVNEVLSEGPLTYNRSSLDPFYEQMKELLVDAVS